jgi:hypothetical protein
VLDARVRAIARAVRLARFSHTPERIGPVR